MRAITARQQEMLDLIREHVATHGWPPTVRELGARMGIRSTNGVIDHLKALERKGFIARNDMLSRGIRLIDGHPLPPPQPSPQGQPGVTTRSPRLLELMWIRGNIADQLRLVDQAIELEKRVACAGR